MCSADSQLSPYTVSWLRPEDADEAAALEARVHTEEHRAGEDVLWQQLQYTSSEGRNLSLGLYLGERLVGLLLAFEARSRREIAEFFEAPIPDGLDPDARTVYLADFVVEPEHRRASGLLAARLAVIGQSRPDLQGVPVDAFSTEEYARIWSARAKFFARVGLRMTGKHAFHDAKLGTTIYWINFEQTVRQLAHPHAKLSDRLAAPRNFGTGAQALTVGCITSVPDWQAFESTWNELAERTSSAGFPRYELLLTWWGHVGSIADLCIVAALRDGRPVAFAPMQVERTTWMGRPVRRLCRLGEHSAFGANPLITTPADTAAADAIAEYIATRNDAWDIVMVNASADARHYLSTLRKQQRRAGKYSSIRPGSAEGTIFLTQGWAAYLARRPAGLIRQLNEAEQGLRQSGELGFETISTPQQWPAALARFIAIEDAVPERVEQGVTATSASVSFFRALADSGQPAIGLRFGFLTVGNVDVAGMLGMVHDGTFRPLHLICHPAWTEARANLVVTARQFEHVFGQERCTRVVLARQVIPRCADWATGTTQNRTLESYPGSWSGLVQHMVYSVLKPRIKRLLAAFGTSRVEPSSADS